MAEATKSLAAEIEAVLNRHLIIVPGEDWPVLIGVPKAAAEIAALQGRAFEDGARWMRWQAQECLAQMKPTAIMPAASGEGYIKALERADARVAALPLQPEGESDPAPAPSTSTTARGTPE